MLHELTLISVKLNKQTQPFNNKISKNNSYTLTKIIFKIFKTNKNFDGKNLNVFKKYVAYIFYFRISNTSKCVYL